MTFKWNESEHKRVARHQSVVKSQKALADAIIAATMRQSRSRRFNKGLKVLRQDEQGLSVGTEWPFAHLVEWGSVNNPPQAPLRRAISSLHITFKEQGR